MSELKIRFELNKGQQGMPIDKLSKITGEIFKFFKMFSADTGLEKNESKWIASNFDNNSVDFDCCFKEQIEDEKLSQVRKIIYVIIKDEPNQLEYHMVRRETLCQFKNIQNSLELQDSARIGIYGDEGINSIQWFELKYSPSVELNIAIEPNNLVYGEVQGIVHAFFKENIPPYLRIRELSTQNLVNCYFNLEMYHSAIEMLEDPEAVIFVEGWLKEDADTGNIKEIKVKDFRPAPEFNQEIYHKLQGSIPDYTGKISSEKHVRGLRNDR
ncbi:MAG: hypothetical protein WAX69_14170 [Victivallales bacterium]